MFAGHHGYIEMILGYVRSGKWPAHLAAAELDDLARQALVLALKARREAAALKKKA